jgi:hypothetical protein
VIHNIWIGDVLLHRIDTDANTITTFDGDGNAVSVRELTEAERLAADPPPAPPPTDIRLETLEAAEVDHRRKLDAIEERIKKLEKK